MKRLTVLFDDRCLFCIRCATWLRQQRQIVPLELLPISHPLARVRYPELSAEQTGVELIVVADDGSVYRGPKAFLITLYALRDYRKWSRTLATPALLPAARAAFHALSRRRSGLSKLLGGDREALIAELTRGVSRAPEECRDGVCR